MISDAFISFFFWDAEHDHVIESNKTHETILKQFIPFDNILLHKDTKYFQHFETFFFCVRIK